MVWEGIVEFRIVERMWNHVETYGVKDRLFGSHPPHHLAWLGERRYTENAVQRGVHFMQLEFDERSS